LLNVYEEHRLLASRNGLLNAISIHRLLLADASTYPTGGNKALLLLSFMRNFLPNFPV